MGEVGETAANQKETPPRGECSGQRIRSLGWLIHRYHNLSRFILGAITH